MPRISFLPTEDVEQALGKLLTELTKNNIQEADPSARYEFPGRLRFLRKGYLRRQMWRQHTASIMKNFEQIKTDREEIRRRLRIQRNNATDS